MQGMIAIVNGPGPQSLNGYADHNPIKLFLLAEFKRLYKYFEITEVHTPLALGTCMWGAEAALTAGLSYYLYADGPEYPPRWTNTQKEQAAALINNAKQVIYDKQEMLSRLGNKVPEEVVLLEVLRDGGGASGNTIKALRLGMRVHTIDPHKAPPIYQVSALLEQVRSAIPSTLLGTVESALNQFEQLRNTQQFTPNVEQKINERLVELEELRKILTSLKNRK